MIGGMADNQLPVIEINSHPNVETISIHAHKKKKHKKKKSKEKEDTDSFFNRAENNQISRVQNDSILNNDFISTVNYKKKTKRNNITICKNMNNIPNDLSSDRNKVEEFSSSLEFPSKIQDSAEYQFSLIEPNFSLDVEKISTHENKIKKHKTDKNLNELHSYLKNNESNQITILQDETKLNSEFISNSNNNNISRRNKNKTGDNVFKNLSSYEHNINEVLLYNSNLEDPSTTQENAGTQFCMTEPNSSVNVENISIHKCKKKKHKRDKDLDECNFVINDVENISTHKRKRKKHKRGKDTDKPNLVINAAEKNQNTMIEGETILNGKFISDGMNKKKKERKKNETIDNVSHDLYCHGNNRKKWMVHNLSSEFLSTIQSCADNQFSVIEPNFNLDSQSISSPKHKRKKHKKNKDLDDLKFPFTDVLNENADTQFSMTEPNSIHNVENISIHKYNKKKYKRDKDLVECNFVINDVENNQITKLQCEINLNDEFISNGNNKSICKDKNKIVDNVSNDFSSNEKNRNEFVVHKSNFEYPSTFQESSDNQLSVIEPNSSNDVENISTHKHKRKKHKRGKYTDKPNFVINAAKNSQNTMIQGESILNSKFISDGMNKKKKERKKMETIDNVSNDLYCDENNRKKLMTHSLSSEFLSIIQNSADNQFSVIEPNFNLDTQTISSLKHKRKKHKKDKDLDDLNFLFTDVLKETADTQFSMTEPNCTLNVENISIHKCKKKKHKRDKDLDECNFVINDVETNQITKLQCEINLNDEFISNDNNKNKCKDKNKIVDNVSNDFSSYGKKRNEFVIHKSNFEYLSTIQESSDNCMIVPNSSNDVENISTHKHKRKKHKRGKDLDKCNFVTNATENNKINAMQSETNLNGEFISDGISKKKRKIKTLDNVSNVPEKGSYKKLQNISIIGDNPQSLYGLNANFTEDPVCFEIPPLHAYETVGIFSESQKNELIFKGVTMKTGKFTKAEDEIIMNNFKAFTKTYNVSDPFELLGIGRYKRDGHVLKFIKSKHFYVKLGEGLNDRSLRSIYLRARKLLHPHRNLDVSDKKDVPSMKWLQKTIGNKWSKMADILGKDSEKCLQSYRWHSKDISKGQWTDEEKETLIKAVQKVAGSSDVSYDNMKKISWQNVANYVPTKNFSQCRWYWANHLAWKSDSLKMKWNKACAARLVDVLNKDWNVQDASMIDWENIQESFKDVAPSPAYIQKKWLNLKYQITNYKTMIYKDIIKKLCIMYNVASKNV